MTDWSEPVDVYEIRQLPNGDHVLVKHRMLPDATLATPVVESVRGYTLQELRVALARNGRHCLPADPVDTEGGIVESWI